MTDEPTRPDPHAPPHADATERAPSERPPSKRPVAIVGIGGSAGALDAYERFFLGLPSDSGMAFVVVPHLDPDHPGLMPEILARCTNMPVTAITDGTAARPDHVYVVPPGRSLTILNETLLLEDLAHAQGRVIDRFLESLAADQGERAIALILSGQGSDGARGVQAVKGHFGVVFAQDPETAAFPAMPRGAVATQLVDHVLPPEDLAPQLYALVTRRRALQVEDVDPPQRPVGAPLEKILRLVRVRTGHDFTHYKRNTLVRRIDRRMKHHRIEDISQYVRFAHESPGEAEALFQDFTINVTSFFRDPQAFDDLKNHLRAYILAHKQDMDQMRVWVAACSTGEEAYSVAMVLRELMEELRDTRAFKVQLFATDVDASAIEKARLARYPADITYVVPPERLARHFDAKDDGYQVKPEVRDLVLFTLHNTFRDPPFMRLDLVCCRNMLIYLGPELQQQSMKVFHYALRPHGLLFLGASETVGAERDRFTTLGSRWKIYQRNDGGAGPLPVINLPSLVHSPAAPNTPPASRSAGPVDVSHLAQRLLVSHHAPPAVVVNEAGDIVYVHGRTARYLELPGGDTKTNVFEMARGALRYELPALVRQAIADGMDVSRVGVTLEIDGTSRTLNVAARPLRDRGAPLVLIEFQEHTGGGVAPAPLEKTDHVLVLERELQHSKESLQATIEEMAVSMDELKSTNEELQSTNEEMQSTNEELTTSKEELQSLNEELTTINAEHQRVIQDLGQVNDDMKNLLESAGIATVFLSNDLRVKRFTPRITRVINLMPIDVGRRVTDLSVNLRYEHLTRDITRVLDTLEAFEAQVQTHDDQWYLMRISPYRTSDNFIDGVVVAFTNIDLVKSLEDRLRHTTAYAERVLDTLHDPLLVLDHELRIVTANRALHAFLRTTPRQVTGERVYDIGEFVLDVPELHRRLQDVVATEEPVTNYVVDLDVPHAGRRKMKIEVEPVANAEGAPLVLLKLEDVTTLVARAANDGPDVRGAVDDRDTPRPDPGPERADPE